MDTDHPWSTPSFCPVASRSSASTEAGDAQLSAASVSKDSVPAVKSKVVKDTKVARLEAALSALGDQESTAKAALQEALRKARMEAKVVRHPQERAAEAADRINRLQFALLGHDSPDAEHLKASLKKVQEQSRVRPLGERFGFFNSSNVRKDACLVQRPGSSKPRKTSSWQNLNWPQAQQDLARMREEASVSDDPPPVQVPRCDPDEELSAPQGSGGEARGRDCTAQAITRVVSFLQPTSFPWMACQNHPRCRGSVQRSQRVERWGRT